MESFNEKRPLLGDPEQVAVPPVYQAQLARAERRRRVARRVKLAAIAVALFFVFSSSSGFGITALLSSIIPALERPGLSPSPSDPSSPSSPSSPSTTFPLGRSIPLDGPLALPDDGLCADYNGGNGLKSYPTATYPLVFDAQHAFAFRQNATEHDHEDYDKHYRYVRVLGEVVVRKTAGSEPSVVVEALSNDDRIRTLYDFVEGDQKLQVTVDDRIHAEETSTRGHPCLVVRATVWLPDGDNHLKNLLIANTHLGIQLIDDTNLVVDDYARLTSVVGSITASRPLVEETKHWYSKAATSATTAAAGYRFEAPNTDVETTSSAISGPWTLRDRLHFGSVSGSIHVSVAPESTESDKIADLSFQTTSGSITFEETSEATSPHTLSVTTRSGTIRGAGSFARTARLHSTSGSITAELAVSLSEKATLNTNTVSGSTDITVKSTDKLDFLDRKSVV